MEYYQFFDNSGKTGRNVILNKDSTFPKLISNEHKMNAVKLMNGLTKPQDVGVTKLSHLGSVD